MNFVRRAFLYTLRKKGKTLSVFLLITIVSTFLISCLALLDASERLVEELRGSVGAAFYIRANKSVVTDENGGMTVAEQKIHITKEDIEQILECGNIAYCNPINYGYAKSRQMAFASGEQDTPENNMGAVTALNYSALAVDFSEGLISLKEGRHITRTDTGCILISSEVAAENNLSVGAKVVLESAELGTAYGKYVDSWPRSREKTEVTVVGIYEVVLSDDRRLPTAEKRENRIFASLDVLTELKESEPSVYTGEVGFYLNDPAVLEESVQKVRKLESMDWEKHFIRTNDLQYSKVSGSLLSLENFLGLLFICVSVVSAAILALLLMLRNKGRMAEAGILLAVGIPKRGVVMQFLLEVLPVAIIAFALSYAVSFGISDCLGKHLFADMPHDLLNASFLKTGLGSPIVPDDYISIRIENVLILCGCQFVAIVGSVLLSSLPVWRLKPREILTEIN